MTMLAYGCVSIIVKASQTITFISLLIFNTIIQDRAF